MAAKGYTTEAKVEAFLGKAITNGALDDNILAAEKMIDNITGRNFKADSAASARLYDGEGGNELVIDDCISVTKVELGNDYWGDAFTEAPFTGTDRYYTDPANNAAEGVPIRKIILRNRLFIEGRANQKITAKWGWSAAVPDDIVYAATVLVAMMYEYGRSGGVGGVQSERIGNYSVQYKTGEEKSKLGEVITILDKYKKYEL